MELNEVVSGVAGIFKKDRIRLVGDDVVGLTPKGKEAAETIHR